MSTYTPEDVHLTSTAGLPIPYRAEGKEYDSNELLVQAFSAYIVQTNRKEEAEKKLVALGDLIHHLIKKGDTL